MQKTAVYTNVIGDIVNYYTWKTAKIIRVILLINRLVRLRLANV